MPPVAVQFTAVFDVPVTVAVNCCVWPGCKEAPDGETLTETTGGGGGTAIVTLAEAVFEESAADVAITVKLPAGEFIPITASASRFLFQMDRQAYIEALNAARSAPPVPVEAE